jgi:hypothetical protein
MKEKFKILGAFVVGGAMVISFGVAVIYIFRGLKWFFARILPLNGIGIPPSVPAIILMCFIAAAILKASEKRDAKRAMEKFKIEGADEQSVRALEKVLWGAPEKEAQFAVIALGEIGSLQAVKALCSALTMHGDWAEGRIRNCAADTLVRIGPPAVEELCLMLNNDDLTVRAGVANALGLIGDASAVKALRARLWRIDDPIQRFVSWAFDEKIDCGFGARRTPWDLESDALRAALTKCGDTVNYAEKHKQAIFGNILTKLMAAVILVAALALCTYKYYSLLRWVAFGVCAYATFQTVQNKRVGWPWFFAIAAVVLNPILLPPVELGELHRDDRAFVVIAAVPLLLAIVVIDIRRRPRS